MSIRPAARKTPSSPELADPRTESGERKIALPSDLAATRISERFRLPDEALPSTPPPPPRGVDDEPAAIGRATTRLAVPEALKLLNAAIPTPHAFEPEPLFVPEAERPTLVVPEADRPTTVDFSLAAEKAPKDDEPLEAPAASERPRAIATPARRRQIVSALALFVVLVSASAIALWLCAAFFR